MITLLNTNWPEKYRPNTTPTDDAAKEAVAEFKKVLREERQKAKAERAAAKANGNPAGDSSDHAEAERRTTAQGLATSLDRIVLSATDRFAERSSAR